MVLIMFVIVKFKDYRFSIIALLKNCNFAVNSRWFLNTFDKTKILLDNNLELKGFIQFQYQN